MAAKAGRRLNIRIVDRYADSACGATGSSGNNDSLSTFNLAADGDANAIHDAKKICAQCPIRRRCLDDALDAEQGRGLQYRWGVFGGLDRHERHAEARRRDKAQVAAAQAGDAA